ncbi:MAG TPA: hypothetical protein DD671_00130 [Balneolaceae bacterium]|nr:hypothetical protein [Balneolaceae bacterium]
MPPQIDASDLKNQLFFMISSIIIDANISKDGKIFLPPNRFLLLYSALKRFPCSKKIGLTPTKGVLHRLICAFTVLKKKSEIADNLMAY